MPAFVIEKDGEIKEKFSYEILFNLTTQQSLVAYSHANYGSEAIFRYMTDEEKADFLTLAQDFHLGNDKVWHKTLGEKKNLRTQQHKNRTIPLHLIAERGV